MKNMYKNKVFLVIVVVVALAVLVGICFKVPIAAYLDSIRSSGMAGFGGGDKKEVTVTCSVPAGYPSQPVYVNRPVQWHINATAKSGSINSYWYTPVYDGVAGTKTKFKDEEFDIAKTYSTIGKKKFKLTVEKAGASSGECSEVEVLVKVGPSIINR